jgi:hypothetical protein
VLAEVEAIGLGLVEQGREDALALDERRVPQVEAIEVEQVEREVDHALRAARGEIVLQGVEVGDAGLTLHDYLAVENQGVGREVGESTGRSVVAPAREELRAAVPGPVTIVLDLGEPSIPRWVVPLASSRRRHLRLGLRLAVKRLRHRGVAGQVRVNTFPAWPLPLIRSNAL